MSDYTPSDADDSAKTDPSEPTESAASSESSPDLLVPPSRQGFRGALGGDGGGAFGNASHAPASVRHIDWAAAFPFVHLFKAFRVAIHPPKLMLALLAVLLIYGGGRALDGLFSLFGDDWRALPGEVERYERFHGEQAAVTPGPAAGGLLGGAVAPEPARPTGTFREFRAAEVERQAALLETRRQQVARTRGIENVGSISNNDLIDAVRTARDDEIEAAELELETAPDDLRDGVRRDRDRRIALAREQATLAEASIRERMGRGVWREFYEYEVAQFDRAIGGILALDFVGPRGVLASLYRMVWVAPVWAFTQHLIYSALLGVWTLVVLSILGGALARVAAVQVARDEKISLRSALRFSTGKFVSFLSAPLIPVLVIALIVASIAIVVLVLSLIGLIPNMGWVTEFGVAILLGVALLGGFVMALTFVGLIGGISLMYPTIAVEGTDSFDAISRSFSYLFARPWRLVFYALVSLAYGAVTFLFLRLFVWLVLACTHGAISLAVLQETAGTDLLQAMWPAPPSPDQLSHAVDYGALTWTQGVAAFIIAFWVYLVIALLAAYALSLYLSSGTIIYFLMRREVDATDLDEVYFDPADEEYAGYADVPEDPSADPENPPAAPPAGKPADAGQ